MLPHSTTLSPLPIDLQFIWFITWCCTIHDPYSEKNINKVIDAPCVFRKKPGKKNQERPFSIFQPSPVAAQFPASGTRSFMPLGAFDRGGKVARNAPGFQLFDTSYRRFFASSLMIVLLMFYFVQLLFHLFSPMLIIMNLLYNHTDVE